jgi:hypothetical protein
MTSSDTGIWLNAWDSGNKSARAKDNSLSDFPCEFVSKRESAIAIVLELPVLGFLGIRWRKNE